MAADRSFARTHFDSRTLGAAARAVLGYPARMPSGVHKPEPDSKILPVVAKPALHLPALVPEAEDLVKEVLAARGIPVQDYNENVSRQFLAIPPAELFVLMRNVANAKWISKGNWVKELDAYSSSCRKLTYLNDLPKQFSQDQIRDLVNSGILTDDQQHVLAYVSQSIAKGETPDIERCFYYPVRAFSLASLANTLDCTNPDVAAILKPSKEKTYDHNLLRLLSAENGQVSTLSMREACKAEADVITIFELCGIELPNDYMYYAHVDSEAGISQASASRQANGIHNQDSMFSATIGRLGLPEIRIDGVFDGMGGHADGSVASGIAAEVLAIYALSHRVKHPNDVREALLAAQVCILYEQLKHTNSDVRKNNMGTTGVVTFVCGSDFYAIHVGDSQAKVIREGETIFETVEHTVLYQFYTEIRERTARELRSAWLNQGRNPDQEGDKFETEVELKTQEIIKPYDKANSPVVGSLSSALGTTLEFIHINNKSSGNPSEIQAVKMKQGDIVYLSSDGVGVPVCDHEVTSAVKTSTDVQAAMKQVIGLAESRPKHQEYNTTCSCGSRMSKQDDDKTVILFTN